MWVSSGPKRRQGLGSGARHAARPGSRNSGRIVAQEPDHDFSPSVGFWRTMKCRLFHFIAIRDPCSHATCLAICGTRLIPNACWSGQWREA